MDIKFERASKAPWNRGWIKVAAGVYELASDRRVCIRRLVPEVERTGLSGSGYLPGDKWEAIVRYDPDIYAPEYDRYIDSSGTLKDLKALVEQEIDWQKANGGKVY